MVVVMAMNGWGGLLVVVGGEGKWWGVGRRREAGLYGATAFEILPAPAARWWRIKPQWFCFPAPARVTWISPTGARRETWVSSRRYCSEGSGRRGVCGTVGWGTGEARGSGGGQRRRECREPQCRCSGRGGCPNNAPVPGCHHYSLLTLPSFSFTRPVSPFNGELFCHSGFGWLDCTSSLSSQWYKKN